MSVRLCVSLVCVSTHTLFGLAASLRPYLILNECLFMLEDIPLVRWHVHIGAKCYPLQLILLIHSYISIGLTSFSLLVYFN